MDTYTRKKVPHCPNCNSQRVHHNSRVVWVFFWIVISLSLAIVKIGLYMLLATPLVFFVPGFWLCRNCKQKTRDGNMKFQDVTEDKIDHNDRRPFF